MDDKLNPPTDWRALALMIARNNVHLRREVKHLRGALRDMRATACTRYQADTRQEPNTILWAVIFGALSGGLAVSIIIGLIWCLS